MVLGYNNRMAYADLSSRSVSYFRENDGVLRTALGGRGLGAAILYGHSRASEPLSESSLLFAGVGPFTGSGFPLANRLTFVFWSPRVLWSHRASPWPIRDTAPSSALPPALRIRGAASTTCWP